MGIRKLAAKVTEYNDRLESGKASKIKPDHVEKVLAKLRKKSVELEEELDEATTPEKKARLEQKHRTAREQIKRGEWLLDQIRPAHD